MKMTFDEVKALFAELCRQQGIPAVEFDETESATMPVGEKGLVLHIQYRRDVGDVVLLAPLGELPAAPAETVTYMLEALLSANLYWQGTRGATIAWNLDLDQPVLQYAVPEEMMTPPSMAAVLADYLESAESWRENVAGLAKSVPALPEPEENEIDEDDDEPSQGDVGFIRV